MENNLENTAGILSQETTSETAVQGKDIAIISYITIIGLVIAFIMNSEKKASFAYYHIRQVTGLAVTGLALWIIGIIPILGWLILIVGSFCLLIMWIMGLMNAINGKEAPVPILGKKYEEWFKGIGK
ncbi:MAG: hypothetical protein ABI123_07305 [Ginsengibacter sp.]|jgi:uncharacterized membrane protein